MATSWITRGGGIIQNGPFSFINTETTYVNATNQHISCLDAVGDIVKVHELAGHEHIDFNNGFAIECGLITRD